MTAEVTGAVTGVLGCNRARTPSTASVAVIHAQAGCTRSPAPPIGERMLAAVELPAASAA